MQGKRRRYTIDFVVKCADKDIPVAIEIKNNYTRDQDLNHNKYEAFCGECFGILELLIWSNEDINKFNLKLRELISSDRVTVLYPK